MEDGRENAKMLHKDQHKPSIMLSWREVTALGTRTDPVSNVAAPGSDGFATPQVPVLLISSILHTTTDTQQTRAVWSTLKILRVSFVSGTAE